MKVGFTLMPIALEGLGRISHLINIDTVEDLVVLMKTVLTGLHIFMIHRSCFSYLLTIFQIFFFNFLFLLSQFLIPPIFYFLITAQPPAPLLVQLHCIHCAMKTLSGPGSELKMDDEVFVTSLRILVKEIPIQFERWDVALDCLDLSLCKRREGKPTVVLGFVRLLFLHSSHMMSDAVGLALLAMANTILLKYPRVRIDLFAPVNHGKQEDDEVGDLAMKALRGADASSHDDEEGDGSWILSLLKVFF